MPMDPVDLAELASGVTALTDGDVATVVPLVTVMARAYTRGGGFTNGRPNEEIMAVITTAAARLAANGAQTRQATTAGVFTQDLKSAFEGWTLVEQMVLNRYRTRAM